MKLPFTKKDGDYYDEAGRWEVSIDLARERTERLALRMAAAMTAVALGVVLLQFVGKPRVVEKPTIVRVDEIRGTVEVETSVTDAKTTYSEALTKRDLRAYVRAREGYLRATAEDDFTRVQLLSCDQEQQRYRAYYNPSNPDSPLNRYGADGKARVLVKSVNFLPHSKQVATVRFTREEAPDNLATTQPKRTEWISTITFRYVEPPKSESEREINPLGFQACEYRRDPDSGDAGSEAR